jgi:hypothetical protein
VSGFYFPLFIPRGVQAWMANIKYSFLSTVLRIPFGMCEFLVKYVPVEMQKDR